MDTTATARSDFATHLYDNPIMAARCPFSACPSPPAFAARVGAARVRLAAQRPSSAYPFPLAFAARVGVARGSAFPVADPPVADAPTAHGRRCEPAARTRSSPTGPGTGCGP